MADFTDNEDLDAKKKALEIVKLDREIRKIEAETEEIISKKTSAWAPMIGSIIIGLITLSITWGTGFFNGKLELIEAQSIVMNVRKDNLSKKIDSLTIVYRKDSISLLTRIKNQDRQLDSLSQKFIQDKTRFDKERLKYGYEISQKEEEILKIERCLPKAKEFLKCCILYDEQVLGLSNADSLMRGYNPPYKTRFNRPLKEVANMNLSEMNYRKFLEVTANFKIDSSFRSFTTDMVSADGKVRVVLRANYGNITVRRTPMLVEEIKRNFDCFKDLTPEQRLRLLQEVIQRK